MKEMEKKNIYDMRKRELVEVEKKIRRLEKDFEKMLNIWKKKVYKKIK